MTPTGDVPSVTPTDLSQTPSSMCQTDWRSPGRNRRLSVWIEKAAVALAAVAEAEMRQRRR